MAKNQSSLGKELEAYFKKNYNSPHKFAEEAHFNAATLAYMLRKNSFKLDNLEEIGKFDEKVIDITINYLRTKKADYEYILNEPLTVYGLAERQSDNQVIITLQQRLITANTLIIDLQLELQSLKN